jgi:AcrR family transcriptional regulator
MTRIAKSEREEFLAAVRHKLLHAALVEFGTRGFEAANINSISQAAGFSKGTVYNYFESKEALMLELIAETGAEHQTYMQERVRQASEPVERLYTFYETGFAFVAEHPREAHFLITTLNNPRIAFRQAMQKTYEPMFRLVAEEVLAPGMQSGVFMVKQPMALASMLMTIYLGTSSTVDESGKPYMDARQVAEFVLRSLREDAGTREEK